MGKRIVWADNLKGFLALLVMVGHTIVWSGLTDKLSAARLLYFLICSFHMPAFFVVGGYLVGIKKEPVTFSMRKSLSRILNLMVPTACAMIVYAMTQRYLGGVPYSEIIVNTWYWFVCVMAAVSVLYPVLCLILRSEVSRLILLLSLFLISKPISNFVSMFFGYFLCYDFGAALGRGQENCAIIKITDASTPRILATVLCAGIMVWAYRAFGYEAVVDSLYKIPVGLLLSVLLISAFPRFQNDGLFAEAGKVTLHSYLFQFAVFRWVENYTGNFSLITAILVFVSLTAACFFAPVMLHRRFKNTNVYQAIFNPSKFVMKRITHN